MSEIEQYNSYDYPIEVRRINDQFYLTPSDLNLAARNVDLSEAYAELDQRRRDLFEHHAELGTLSSLPLPSNVKLRRDLKPFFIKAATVAVVGVFLFSAASISFTYAVREPLRQATQRVTRTIMKDVTREMNEFAADPQSQERVEKIRLAIRAAVPNLKPYVDELRPLFVEPAQNSDQ